MKPSKPQLLSRSLTAILATAPLTVSAQPLQPIVVTATTTAHEQRDAPASVSVIDGAELRQRPVQDLAGAVRESTGISLVGAGFTRQGISIRGMETDHSLILVDGKRISAADDVIAHADFNLGWVPAEAVERIEVVRGPMSSLYGSEALGGVVNVITRAPTDEWRASATAGGGVRADDRGGERRQLAAYAGGPLIVDRLGLTVHGEFQSRANTPQEDEPRLSEREAREVLSGGASLTFTPNADHRFDLGYSQTEEERRRDTVARGAYYESRDDISRRHYSLAHRGSFGTTWSSLRAYRSTLERENRRSDGVTPTPPQRLTDDVIDGHVSSPLGESHLVTVGGEYRRERLEDESFTRTGSETAHHRALFLQDEWLLTDQLLLTGGVRGDDHEAFGWQFSPRLHAVYHLSERFTVKGGYGQGFKAPTLKQLSPQFETVGGGGGFTISGNPELEPEASASYEAGIEYHGARTRAGITAFNTDIEDLIQIICVENCATRGPQQQRTYTNVDQARIRGIESELDLALGGGFMLRLNHTYLDARDRTADERLAERPRHSGAARLRWQATAGLSLDTRAQYVGEQVSYRTEAGQRIREDLPAYTLWHLALAQRLGEHLTVRAGIDNVADVRPAEESAHFGYPEEGRFYHLALTASF